MSRADHLELDTLCGSSFVEETNFSPSRAHGPRLALPLGEGTNSCLTGHKACSIGGNPRLVLETSSITHSWRGHRPEWRSHYGRFPKSTKFQLYSPDLSSHPQVSIALTPHQRSLSLQQRTLMIFFHFGRMAVAMHGSAAVMILVSI